MSDSSRSGNSIQGLIDDLADERRRTHAVAKLKEIGEPAIPFLIRALGDDRKKAFAAVALEQIGKPRAIIPFLLESLGERNEQDMAAALLQKLGTPDIILPSMLEALGHKSRQAMAVSIMKKMGMPALEPAIPFLIDAIDDETKRPFAGLVLESIGYQAVEPLTNVSAMDKNKRKYVAMILEGMSKKGDSATRAAATKALSQIRTPSDAGQPPRLRFCPHCGNELSGGHVFCSNCGKKADGFLPNSTESAPSPVTPVDVGEESVIGGFASSDIVRQGGGLAAMGYGIYVTNRRIVGVKTATASKELAGKVAGAVIGGLVGGRLGAQVASRVLGDKMSTDESRRILEELEKSKDFEAYKQDISIMELKSPGVVSALAFGRLLITMKSGNPIVIGLSSQEVYEKLKPLLRSFHPQALRLVN